MTTMLVKYPDKHCQVTFDFNKTDVEALICDSWVRGHDYRKIADWYGVPRSRIRRILVKFAGVSHYYSTSEFYNIHKEDACAKLAEHRHMRACKTP